MKWPIIFIALLLAACASKPIYKTEIVEVPKSVRCSMRLPPAPRRYLTEETSPKEVNSIILAQAAIGEIFELDQYIIVLSKSIETCIDIIP